MIIETQKDLNHRNLYSFFYNAVKAVNLNNNYFQLNDYASNYLITVLSDNNCSLKSLAVARSDKSVGSLDLTHLSLKKILNNPRSTRMNGLKTFGDNTLLVSGFFYKSVSNKVLSYSYYETLGREAYNYLGYYSKSEFCEFKENPSQLFDFFAGNYSEVANFLSDVSDLVFLIAGMLNTEEAKVPRLTKHYNSYQKILHDEPPSGIIIIKA